MITTLLRGLCVLSVLGSISVLGGSIPVSGQAGQATKSALERSLEMRRAQTPSDGEIHVLPAQGNVYMLVGAGGNVAVQASAEGVMVVDTGTAQMSDKLLAAIKKLSDKPIRHVINTHFHSDHIGGNETIAKAGSTTRGGTAEILAHENVMNRVSAPVGKPGATSPAAWPSNTYFPEEKDIFFNDEAVMFYHDANAHTDGDTIVFFRRSDVVVTGDIFVTTSYPVIEAADGGSVQGVIAGLNRILDLAVPRHEQEGGTMIIPGHGKLSDESEVLEYRDMVVIIKERIEDMVKRGMTVEQVKAAKPTFDYDRRYGAATGAWTTEMFVDAVYRSLVPKS